MADLFVNVIGFKLNSNWWKSSKADRSDILKALKGMFKDPGDGKTMVRAELYSSLRPDTDIILWLISSDSRTIVDFKAKVMKLISGVTDIRHGFLSLYRRNPGEDYKRTNNGTANKFFVAYPVKKMPEWYLLGREERSRIMAEHIATAVHGSKKDSIISYTTRSFGIGDADFFVMYELESLSDWVDIAEKLRSVEAHRWVSREDPILVGEKTEFEELMQ